MSFSQCNPDAGLNDTICELYYTFSASIGDMNSMGTWNTNEPGATFSNINDTVATICLNNISVRPVANANLPDTTTYGYRYYCHCT